jgi:hypothetical protein
MRSGSGEEWLLYTYLQAVARRLILARFRRGAPPLPPPHGGPGYLFLEGRLIGWRENWERERVKKWWHGRQMWTGRTGMGLRLETRGRIMEYYVNFLFENPGAGPDRLGLFGPD